MSSVSKPSAANRRTSASRSDRPLNDSPLGASTWCCRRAICLSSRDSTADGSAAELVCGLIRPGGRYVALRGLPDEAFVAKQAARGIRCVSASGPASIKDFPLMGGLVAQGLIKPTVSAVYPLAEFRDALERVSAGHVRGKLVLEITA